MSFTPSTDVTLTVTRWFAQRYNVNNAWNFNGNSGNLNNNNNVTSANRCQAVTNLQRRQNVMTKRDKEWFDVLVCNYFETRKNKRYGRDAVSYEMSWVANTVRFMSRLSKRTFRIDHNYAFLTSIPRWREIFATIFVGRQADHLLCDKIRPYVEKFLPPYTYNNREGKGSQAAINQLVENIYEVTNGYTEDARIIKLDFKGFFPSALWSYAEKCFLEVICSIPSDEISDDERVFLQWLTMVLVNANPAGHYERRTPLWLWKCHIPKDKSILCNPEGVGAAIGRMVWQMAMCLYVADIVRWLCEDCGIKTVCFVDDIVMVVPERLHEYALSLIPVLRKKLATRNIRLNERKFYDQPYGHGVEFLGSHIKPFRIHLNNKTYSCGVKRIKELNAESVKDIDKMLNSFNSYGGLLKNRTDYRRLLMLRDMMCEEWWKRLEWNPRKQCVSFQEKYSIKERLNRKYHLHLKKRRK